MVKVGVVGCGGVGLIHSQGYQSHSKAQLKCVCDMDKAKADARANALGVKAYYSVKEMLANEELDLVDVITADHLHFEPVMQALEAGRNVFVEKPLSLKLDETKQMVQKAKEKKVKLAVNYNRRYSIPYRKAKEYVTNGAIGNPTFIMFKLAQGGPEKNHKVKYYNLFELHCHSADLMRHFCGDVEEVSAYMVNPRAPSSGFYTTVAMCLKFKGETTGTLIGSWDSSYNHPIEYMEICGEKGFICVDNIMEGVRLYIHNDRTIQSWRPNPLNETEFQFRNSFINHVHAVVDALDSGKEMPVTGDDGLKSLLILHSAIKSFEEKRSVKLSELEEA